MRDVDVGRDVGIEAMDTLMATVWGSFLPSYPTQQDCQTTEFEVEGLRVRLELCGQGQIGCSLTRLTAWPMRSPLWVLRRVGEEVVARVTCLLEPLELVEVAPRLGLMQIRSARPWKRNGHVEYYELLAALQVDGHMGLSLSRYRVEKGARGRTAVPINLTWEMLERLLDDLAAAFQAGTV